MAKVHKTNRPLAGRRSAQVFLPFGEMGPRSVHKLNKLAVKRNLGREISIVIGDKRKYYRIVQSGKSIRFKRIGEPGASSKIIEIESPVTSAIAQRKRPISEPVVGEGTETVQEARAIMQKIKRTRQKALKDLKTAPERSSKEFKKRKEKHRKRKMKEMVGMTLSQMGIFDQETRRNVHRAYNKLFAHENDGLARYSFFPEEIEQRRAILKEGAPKELAEWFETSVKGWDELNSLLGKKFPEFMKKIDEFKFRYSVKWVEFGLKPMVQRLKHQRQIEKRDLN